MHGTWGKTERLRRQIAAHAWQIDQTAYLVLEGTSGPVHVAIQAMGSAHDPASVLLTRSSPARVAEIPMTALQSLFGLTDAESRLARDPSAGRTLETHARGRSISMGTARWYLKQVLAETGAARQQVLCSAAFQARGVDAFA